MAPPIPIGQFVPPVTGVNGFLAPVANSFDSSGTFRSRSASQKRRRGETGDTLDAVFDLSANYPTISPPTVPTLDKGAIRELLVAAAGIGVDMSDLLADDSQDPKVRTLATATLALYKLVEGIVEKALMPLCESATAAGTVGGYAALANKAMTTPPSHLNLRARRSSGRP